MRNTALRRRSDEGKPVHQPALNRGRRYSLASECLLTARLALATIGTRLYEARRGIEGKVHGNQSAGVRVCGRLDGNAGFVSAQATRETSQIQEVVVTATRRGRTAAGCAPERHGVFPGRADDARASSAMRGWTRDTPGVVLNQAQRELQQLHGAGHRDQRLRRQSSEHRCYLHRREAPISTIGNTDGARSQPVRCGAHRVPARAAGTLFGSGSLSGALRILTRSPDLEESVRTPPHWPISVSRRRLLPPALAAMVNVPLVDDRRRSAPRGFSSSRRRLSR